MAANDLLNVVARDQKRWSLTADALKKSIQTARWTALGLAIAGAICETAAAQIHQIPSAAAPQPDNTASIILGFAGAVALAVTAVIRQWKLGHERLQAWIVTRSASESFKRELYFLRTSTGPYATGEPGDTLQKRRNEILGKLNPYQKYRIEPGEGQLKTVGILDADGYLRERVNSQIKWFIDRSGNYSAAQGKLSGTEFLLVLVAAVLGVLVTVTGNQQWGAWVAVITTITGALATHVVAQRYEQLTVSYRSTADRLEGLAAQWSAKANASIAELVEPAEAVLFEENQGWIAGADSTADNGSKDTTPGPKPPAPKSGQ